MDEDTLNSPDDIQASGSGFGVTDYYGHRSQSSLLSQIPPLLYELQRQSYNYSAKMGMKPRRIERELTKNRRLTTCRNEQTTSAQERIVRYIYKRLAWASAKLQIWRRRHQHTRPYTDLEHIAADLCHILCQLADYPAIVDDWDDVTRSLHLERIASVHLNEVQVVRELNRLLGNAARRLRHC